MTGAGFLLFSEEPADRTTGAGLFIFGLESAPASKRRNSRTEGGNFNAGWNDSSQSTYSKSVFARSDFANSSFAAGIDAGQSDRDLSMLLKPSWR
jgi:hypothetical protein